MDEIDKKIAKFESKKKSKKEEFAKEKKDRMSEVNLYKLKENHKKEIKDSINDYIIDKDPIYNDSHRSISSNIIDEEKRKEKQKEKSPLSNIIKIKENNPSLNNLECHYFNFQPEILGKNILEISAKNQNRISFIDIDLFLQRIAKEKNIYDDIKDNDTLIKGFCIQHPTFITTDILISKIISCFNYFYERYLNQDNEKDNNDNSQSKNRNTFGYRNKFMEQKKDIFDSVAFIQNLKKIPYNLIDLIILFVELHEKYSKKTLTKEIKDKIENFYKTILNVYDIKNKYNNNISESLKVLKTINNISDLKRKKTPKNKMEYEDLINNLNLLDHKLKDPNTPVAFFHILAYDSIEIANELTRITYLLFSKIQPKEFFKGVFTKKNKEITSPNLTEIANRFNKLSFWLIEEILSYDYGKDRAKIIEKFIDIANELINLNNFNDSMSIISALGNVILNNLSKTWNYVSKDKNDLLEKLKKILNFKDNYKNMRDKIDECIENNKPYIPFLGPYNKRICFLEEYGPYVKDNSLINVDKIVLVQEILDQFFKFKDNKYESLQNNKKDFIILQCLDPLEEEELEKLISFLEPTFSLKNKKEKEKRITNTEKNFKNNYENRDDYL